MVNAKAPTLLLSKSPFEYEEKREKICSRSTVSWVLAALLISLVFVAILQFSSPVADGRSKPDRDCIINIYEDQPNIDKSKPPVVTDYVSEHLHENSEGKGKSVKKDTGANPWDLDFLIDPIELCATCNPPDSEQYLIDPEVKLLILVPSATGHFLERKTIRNTWGSIAERPVGPIRLGFVLGTTFNKTEDDLIHEESSKYKDIIQANFDDANRQLTTKSVLMLKWMAERCPHAEYFLKADDNTFVNVSIIANILAGEPFISENKFIGGFVQTGLQPSRILEEKYYVAVEDYSNDEYPPYISGSAYVTNGPTAVELFQASKEVQPFLPMEDIFVTGLLGDHIDATLIHDPRFRYDNPPNPPSWQSISNLATANSISPNIMKLIWNEITESLSAMDHFLNQEAAINATVILGKKRRFMAGQK